MYDRRFDRRRPRITSWPRVRGGELKLWWSVRDTLRGEHATLTGRTGGRLAGGRLLELRDAMVADECARWIAPAARA